MDERYCCDCKERLTLGGNWSNGAHRNGLYRCKSCYNVKERKRYQKNRDQVVARTSRTNKIRKQNDPAAFLYSWAKQRAKKSGIAFTITKMDIVIPSVCPVLGIPLKPSEGAPSFDSPTLDRFDASRGYEPNNIMVISKKANTIKNNATIEEIEQLVAWVEEKTTEAKTI